MSTEEDPEQHEIQMTKEEIQSAVFMVLQSVNANEEHLLRPIELRETSMGKAVFATRDIERGEWITTFPCHFVVIENKEFGIAMDCYKGREIVEEVKNGLLNKFLDHSLGLLQDLTIIGDPEKENDNRLWGHFINDLSFVKDEEYNMDRSNVGFKLLDIHATKDIKAGDELSLCYGPDYWEQRSPLLKS
tara:strand:- start:281 stop:847 length:567 start_codon:yes stop_codon:yes gene_type:complete